jgi:sporulation protein YlmC with PRC-barrel domain
MLPKKLIAAVSMLGLLLPAASFAQSGQQKNQPQQSQTQQGQQQSMDQAQRRQVEERLKTAGFDPGPVDGTFTGETAQALLAYERARGLRSEGLLIIVAEPTRQALMAEQPGKGGTSSATQAIQGAQKELQVVQAMTLSGMEVKDQQGNTLGEIERVMFDTEDGRVAYVVLDFDGWFDIGGRHIAAPWEALKLTPGAREATLAIDKQKLRQAPGFAPTAWPAVVERPWLYDVYNYYGYPPYPALRARTVDRVEVMSADTLVGRDVENRQGEEFGEVADLAIDLSSSRIAYVILEYGGWLGLGEKLAAVPWKALKADVANPLVTMDVDKDKLKTLPSFAREEWPQTLDRQWLANLYDRYGEKPYWETN